MLDETTIDKLENLSHYAMGEDRKALNDALAALKGQPIKEKKLTRRELVRELDRIARDSEFVSVERSLTEAGMYLVKYLGADRVTTAFNKIRKD